MADHATLTGQARRGAQRRDAIVDAAIEVFAEHGFRGGALTEVAERVGLSAAGILYHFGSKEELLLAVIEERDRRLAPILIELAQRGGLGSLTGAVVFAEQSERERGLTALHTVLQAESFEADAPARDYFLARSRGLRAGQAEMLRATQARGEIRDDVDCDAVADQIVAFIEGAAMLWLLDPTTSLIELYCGYFQTLERAIAAP